MSTMTELEKAKATAELIAEFNSMMDAGSYDKGKERRGDISQDTNSVQA